MTPALLATLRAAGRAATPGPWAPSEWYGTDEGGWSAVGPHHLKSEGEEWDDPDSECHERAKLDALFIALARNHWDELLDAAEERDRLRAALRRYGNHDDCYRAGVDACPRYDNDNGGDPSRPCTCGFSAALGKEAP